VTDAAPGGRVRILHLEDDDMDAELIEATLSAGLDCQVRRVVTRAEFMEALEAGGFDVILADYALPAFSGPAALTAVRARWPELPFIFLSGTLGDERAVDTLKAGATDYVLKDHLSRLVTVVRRALDEAAERSARRNAEQALASSQRFLQRVIDATPHVVFVFDMSARRIPFVNRQVASMLGYTPEEVQALGSDLLPHLTHPEDAARIEALIASLAAVRDDEATEFELRVKSSSGTWRSLQFRVVVFSRDGAGAVAQTVGVAEDVTDRRRGEERLREQAALLDLTHEAIFVQDMEYRVRYWNRGAERLYAWPAGEAVGQDVTHLLNVGSRRDLFEARSVVLQDGVWTGILQQRTRDGRDLVVQSSWTLVRAEAGAPRSILVVNTDVTEMRKLEAKFLRSQRMESIGTLAGGIAHDLNNVLSPILMAVGLLRKQVDDARGRRILETLDTSAQRGADMIRQILTFARGAEGERVPLQPAHLIREMQKIAEETFPKSISVRADVADGLWTVSGQATPLQQVLMNLCVNARDAMPQGGSLSLAAENVTLDERAARSNPKARAGPYVLIKVADTGSGIPPDVMDRIFDPFFSTKGLGHGTGLGLSTTLSIVESHGGFIDVYTEVGRGTAFNVYLPALPAGAERRPAAAEPALPTGSGELVLVVDDEPSILEITRETLQDHGYRVLTAPNGRAALVAYERHHREIRLVLTDMSMPMMDGPTTIKALLALDPDIRIVACSGLRSDPGAEQVKGLKVRAFLTKPYTASTLLGTVQKVLAN
jgi:PAS domain S-box-containing protein